MKLVVCLLTQKKYNSEYYDSHMLLKVAVMCGDKTIKRKVYEEKIWLFNRVAMYFGNNLKIIQINGQ